MLDLYREVWAVDFEFIAPPGEQPTPVCLVARELKTNKTIRMWKDQFGPLPPYSIGTDCLFVAYYVSAELGCHLALGWPMPARILDLFSEFRNQTNGLPTVAGRGLIGALAAHGLDSIGTIEKDEWRNLVMRGGPWNDEERAGILDYCEGPVTASNAAKN
jgi:DNA polymerase I